ncbi:MAG: 50S ribosomal protein L23 [Prevotellaceae bacterium]|jgi:large subunit ribosomal protein L23|nr:50S ribosomal protein L23 [Prevotellaceae bacterium]
MSTQLIKPLITEKITVQGDKLNRYGFIVRPEANKLEIKQAVETMYGVKVEKVNTMNYRGKNKSRYTKAGLLSGRTVHRKKAVVTLVKGEQIDFYSSI